MSTPHTGTPQVPSLVPILSTRLHHRGEVPQRSFKESPWLVDISFIVAKTSLWGTDDIGLCSRPFSLHVQMSR